MSNVMTLVNNKLKKLSSTNINDIINNKKTICLNMIVKNEAHILSSTLDNLLKYISFDYWVISDTGSTDGTQKLIKDYFSSKNIKGELFEDEWRDFGHNRTLALQYAKGKTDYLLIFDADDIINGEFKLPEQTAFHHSMYNFKFGTGVSYVRPLLINNMLDWKFNGVLHEYLSCNTKNVEGVLLDGNYYVESGRKGSRSSDPDKYKKDAEVLKNAYYLELDKPNKGLSGRYAFYCAQSYKDCMMNKESIEWYKIVADKINTWNQEKFCACLSLGELYRREQDFENSIKYYTKSIIFDDERIDGIAFACEVLQASEHHLLCCCLGKNYLGYDTPPVNKLFLYDFCYENHIEYSCSISAFYCGIYELGYQCCKKIITSKIAENNDKYIKTCINLSFYTDQLVCDDTDTLSFFYLYNDVIQNIINIGDGNVPVDPKMHKCWNILFEKNRAKLTQISPNIINNYQTIFPDYRKTSSRVVETIITFTTCKRFDLFKETIGSILNHWMDKEKIDYWFCVDDNSSDDDRSLMVKSFPWIKYYMKSESERGHRESMNIIWNKLQELKPKYWIHMEDDFLFYVKRNYVDDSIKVLQKYGVSNNIKQVLFNRNYAETIEDTSIKGHVGLSDGIVISNTDIPVVLHSHNKVENFCYPNCCYWPDYSFRPSMIDAETILTLGNYDTQNQFFEMDYAECWYNAGYRSAFLNLITCRHIGRLTSDRHDKTKPNSYELNNVSQFNLSNSPVPAVPAVSPDIISDEMIRFAYSPPIKVASTAFIKIINLKHREDRKYNTIQQLESASFLPDEYEFIEAIYGKELQPSHELYTLVKGNDYSSRSGFIGCALSHYGLWLELTKDTKNDYYLIMEDDFTLCDDFKTKLGNLNKLNKLLSDDNDDNDADKALNHVDFLFLGYHMFDKDRQKYKDIYDVESPTTKMDKLNKNIYIGGYFSYIITKNGANKMIDHIVKNGIIHGIDYFNKKLDTINSYECQPSLVFSIWCENNKIIDTDIQLNMDCINFSSFVVERDDVVLNELNESNDFIKDNFVFIPMRDQIGFDLYHKKESMYNMALCALKDKQCVAFNTLGFFKGEIKNVTISQWFGEKDGIYIKKGYVNSDVVHRNRLRIKMICNWCSSYQLCKEWSNMCTDPDTFIWNNIEITWDNENIDYYIIINSPPPGEYYKPKRTIVFQMEPWVYDTSKNWGVKTWGEWAEPNPAKFLYVIGRKTNEYNNAFWQLELKLSDLCRSELFKKTEGDKISSIVSSKYFDEGHIARIDFLKFIESRGDLSVDIYNEDNKYLFTNYAGKVTPYIDKSNGLKQYKYYFMVENNYEKDFITEKLWEPILCEALVFYYGCPNVSEYIDPLAFVQLDITNFEKSYEIIKRAIEEDWWSQRIDVIRREKTRILNEMAFFPRISKIINNNL
jgi:GR25 family glycosyltransferase involved in LPS biosynthesis